MVDKFKIEKGVPLRPKFGKYPLREMKIGDSFFVPDVSARTSIYSCARNAKVKVTARREGDGMRVWRIK